MHLAEGADQASGLVEHHGGIVIHPSGATLEDGADDHQAEFGGQTGQTLGGRTFEGLGEIEDLGVFGLAEVVAGMQLLQHHQLSAIGGKATNGGFAGRQACVLVGPALLLDDTDLECTAGSSHHSAP